MSKKHTSVAIMRGTCLGFVAALFVWVWLLVRAAFALRGDAAAHRALHVGPLHTGTLAKQTIANGYQISLQFESGVIWLLLIFCTLGALLFYLIQKRGKMAKQRSVL